MPESGLSYILTLEVQATCGGHLYSCDFSKCKEKLTLLRAGAVALAAVCVGIHSAQRLLQCIEVLNLLLRWEAVDVDPWLRGLGCWGCGW